MTDDQEYEWVTFSLEEGIHENITLKVEPDPELLGNALLYRRVPRKKKKLVAPALYMQDDGHIAESSECFESEEEAKKIDHHWFGGGSNFLKWPSRPPTEIEE